MNPRDIIIKGIGVVSPLGCDAAEFAQRLAAGECGFQRELHFENRRSYPCFSLPKFDVSEIISSSRLRRVSPISQFAAAAAALALRDAKLSLEDKNAMRRTGVVTAVTSGSVVYTAQFHNELVHQGARAVSPMFFPETVYNAPSSHLAAVLGCDHVNYTIVGDAAAAFNAVAMACDLIESGAVDQCLVVGTEEADWVSADAYRRFGCQFTVAEGAGAILLAKTNAGYARLMHVDRGFPFHSRAEIATQSKYASAAALEKYPLAKLFPSIQLQVGEAFTASALWQLIAAAITLSNHQSPVPPQLVSCIGLNEQASAIILGAV